MGKTLDEALARAGENLARLQHIHDVTAEPNLQQLCLHCLCKTREHQIKSLYFFYEQTLTAELAEQILKNTVRLETEVEKVVVKAYHAIHKWYKHCFSNS